MLERTTVVSSGVFAQPAVQLLGHLEVPLVVVLAREDRHDAGRDVVDVLNLYPGIEVSVDPRTYVGREALAERLCEAGEPEQTHALTPEPRRQSLLPGAAADPLPELG